MFNLFEFVYHNGDLSLRYNSGPHLWYWKARSAAELYRIKVTEKYGASYVHGPPCILPILPQDKFDMFRQFMFPDFGLDDWRFGVFGMTEYNYEHWPDRDRYMLGEHQWRTSFF